MSELIIYVSGIISLIVGLLIVIGFGGYIVTLLIDHCIRQGKFYRRFRKCMWDTTIRDRMRAILHDDKEDEADEED